MHARIDQNIGAAMMRPFELDETEFLPRGGGPLMVFLRLPAFDDSAEPLKENPLNRRDAAALYIIASVLKRRERQLKNIPCVCYPRRRGRLVLMNHTK